MANKTGIQPGDVFGRLTVIEEAGRTKHYGRTWSCICVCGGKAVVQQCSLRSGHTKSCGCYHKDRITTHGLGRTPIYQTWRGLIGRAYDPRNSQYIHYGGRGIRVSESWHIFENFFSDMGHSPGAGYSLDRIDNNGDYCKENCRWATKKEQARNTRRNLRITTATGVGNLLEYCEENGINMRRMYQRVKRIKEKYQKAGFGNQLRLTSEELAVLATQSTMDVMDLYLRRVV